MLLSLFSMFNTLAFAVGDNSGEPAEDTALKSRKIVMCSQYASGLNMAIFALNPDSVSAPSVGKHKTCILLTKERKNLTSDEFKNWGNGYGDVSSGGAPWDFASSSEEDNGTD